MPEDQAPAPEPPGERPAFCEATNPGCDFPDCPCGPARHAAPQPPAQAWPQWQPIETRPASGLIFVGWFDGDEWEATIINARFVKDYWKATHWHATPLPPPRERES